MQGVGAVRTIGFLTKLGINSRSHIRTAANRTGAHSTQASDSSESQAG
ncbi:MULTISPECIES: hypothetical protein [unclassified Microcoleus]